MRFDRENGVKAGLELRGPEECAILISEDLMEAVNAFMENANPVQGQVGRSSISSEEVLFTLFHHQPPGELDGLCGIGAVAVRADLSPQKCGPGALLPP